MTEPEGTVVTFYSYKGGTGRTMALANVAWILAANGKRVLAVDWDLESPGLHRFFEPFMRDDVYGSEGIIDMVRTYEYQAKEFGDSPELLSASAEVRPHALPISWDFADGGSLQLLPAGRQNFYYAATLAALDWDNFYERLGGGQFLDELRANMKANYNYVLIDSRTGLSDVADICTLHLPDVLVDCFTLSTQGIEGAAKVAKDVHTSHEREIRVLPVPMRIDPAELKRAQAGLAYARRRFSGLPVGLTEPERRAYWSAVEVPYRAFYAYEETLAVFGDAPGSPTSLLASFERLTAEITHGEVTSLPVMDDDVREKVLSRFGSRSQAGGPPVVIEHAPQDQVWADWIRRLLESAGARVLDSVPTPAGPDEPRPRVLRLISSPYSAPAPGAETATLPYTAVYVADARLAPYFADATAHVPLAGVSPREAVGALLRALNLDVEPLPDGTGFPGTEPRIFRALARNARFTGRERDLSELRKRLRETGTAVVLPVALQGLGGMGKSQLALEYAHRFRCDYDLVWWINAGEVELVDATLSDLADHIERTFGLIAPAGANVTERVGLVLRTLARHEPVGDWLLVFDNAVDVERIERYIPAGRGHKLITSPDRGWEGRAATLAVDLFTPEESVAHLRMRLPSIDEDDALRVAEVVGRLPLAVVAAGAWLAETGAVVDDYLVALEEQGPEALSASPLDGYPATVARTWDLSLARLAERSPAAARMLEMCSVLAPEVHLKLVNSPAMAAVLEPLDPALAEPMVIGKLIQAINNLGLFKLDTNARQVEMHRLVQAVVRARLTPEAEQEIRRDVHQVLLAEYPGADIDDPRHEAEFRMIWPHLDRSQAMTSPNEKVRDLFIEGVRFLWQRGDLEGGRELAGRVEAVWQDMLEKRPDPQLAGQLLRLQTNLSNILRDMAHFEESRALDERVLAAQRELLGPEHPKTLMTAGGLAASLRALGRYRRALDMDRETYAAWRQYGEDMPETLAAANNLAVSYRINGDFTESLRLDRDTYERRRVRLGPVHPRTLDSEAAVARDLLEVGLYADAVSQARGVREKAEHVLGAEHRITLNATALLGVAYRGTGDLRTAQRYFEEALDGLTLRFGRDSSDALSARLSNAANLLALEQLEDGERQIRQVLAVYRTRLGDTHPHTLSCQVNLASALRLKEEMRAALDLVWPANEALEKYLGDEHPYALAATMVLAVLLADMGEEDQARQYEELSARRMASALGPRHPDTLRCRANLLLTRMELGDARAEQERAEVIAELSELLDEGHPHIATLRAGRRLVRAVDPHPF
ncbi:FxSxx-COOH system tetratricopeptide repeat protein [Actinomadura fulvescens]|uniref:CobQ/CobB/MinD/ParA nucleotide binding domain-containing protein n=1 Tax=Actinomadura fulvescens TaxID=46160 RepID=A0ABP6BVQ2_9ACTN